MKAPGKVYLVGAGPGAPDLLTLRAARLLALADVVFYDALVHPDTLALAARAEKIAVGKRCGRHSTAQRFINKRLIDAAQRHSAIVRLKGGDPMLFGRAQEEIDALQTAGIRYEVVPGVTAALAASAELGVSLTRRGVSRSVVFATPRSGADEPANNWLASAASADTIALYMGAGEAAQIAACLIAAGRPGTTPVVIVSGASLPDARRIPTTLAGLPQAAAGLGTNPIMILAGEVYREFAARHAAAASGEAVEQDKLRAA
jgi:uroporphyrin-III C-methyltransferase